MIEFKNDVCFYIFIFLCLIVSLKCIWAMVVSKDDISSHRFVLICCSYCVLILISIPDIYVLLMQLFIQLLYILICTFTLKYTEEYDRLLDFILTSITAIITITNTFGKYYFSNGEIPSDYFYHPDLLDGNSIIIKVWNDFSSIMYYQIDLFKYSIQYYFNFYNEDIYMLQFCCGILLSLLFLGTIATKIEKFLNIK